VIIEDNHRDEQPGFDQKSFTEMSRALMGVTSDAPSPEQDPVPATSADVPTARPEPPVAEASEIEEVEPVTVGGIIDGETFLKS
jgi:hypothetical protein